MAPAPKDPYKYKRTVRHGAMASVNNLERMLSSKGALLLFSSLMNSWDDVVWRVPTRMGCDGEVNAMDVDTQHDRTKIRDWPNFIVGRKREKMVCTAIRRVNASGCEKDVVIASDDSLAGA